MSLTTLFISLLLASVTSASPLSRSTAQSLIVYSPRITSPKAAITWPMGSTQVVTWDTSKIPPVKQNSTGLLLIGHAGNGSEHLDINHPLACGFPIKDGWVSVTMPDNVEPRDDWFVVLFGDSGNMSEKFKIVKY